MIINASAAAHSPDGFFSSFSDGDPFSSHISPAIYEQHSYTYCFTNDVIFMHYILFNILCA